MVNKLNCSLDATILDCILEPSQFFEGIGRLDSSYDLSLDYLVHKL